MTGSPRSVAAVRPSSTGSTVPGAAVPRTGPTRRGLLGALVAGLVVVPLAACGSDDAPAGSPPDDAQVPASTLRLGLTEWSIEASATLLAPGTVEVVVTNTGGTGHDVSISGAAGTWATPVLAPGEQAELTLQTTPGEELSLVCTVAGHHTAGMHRTLTVARVS